MLVFYLHTFNNKTSIIWQNTCINISICADIQCILDHCSACFFFRFSLLLSYCPLKTHSFRLPGLTNCTCNYIFCNFWHNTIHLFNLYFHIYAAHVAAACILCTRKRSSILLTYSLVLLLHFSYYLMLCICTAAVTCEFYSGRRELQFKKKKTCKQTKLKQIKKTCSSV